MSDIIVKRREQFRTEIRKQNLEKEFSKKRFEKCNLIQNLNECNNLIDFEFKYKDQIENQIQLILQNPDNQNLQKLIQLVQQLSAKYSIYIIDHNIYKTLKHNDLDINLCLNLMCNLCVEPTVVKYIFSDQIQKERLTQYLNLISANLYEEHRKLYWEFMLILSNSAHTPFPFLKQVFLICCEELIQCRNSITQMQIRILPHLIQKYPQANQFYWDALNTANTEDRKPWKCLLHYLKQPNSDVFCCDQLILAIYYLVQYAIQKIYYDQIVTSELMFVLQSNLYRHEKTMVRSTKLIFMIFEENDTYFKFISDDLIKLLKITFIDGQIEILKLLEIVLHKRQHFIQLMDQYNIIDILFDILKQKISTTMNYAALNCIALSLFQCTQIDKYQKHIQTQYSNFKDILERFVYDKNKSIQLTTEYLLTAYFEK
ncbi:unnamed protein product [Paramecium primaurelia]|uniref:Uncharacterized protein n=1 Tax=Paramecium primaurelia TaxID=5886 RepID=A0A8S1KX55_PARPR|nr:unnamed protein product [Paramecium primaurelia]